MILITGAGGLIGYSVSNFFLNKNYQIFGIENNKRKILFGKQGSIEKNIINLKKHKKYEGTVIPSEVKKEDVKPVKKKHKKYEGTKIPDTK